MRLDHMTWPEVEMYLKRSGGIMIPTGSTEQHGPMGLIGTDALCAQAIAEKSAVIADAVVAPCLAYTPAPFNTAFPGTISISAELFYFLACEIVDGLVAQGFTRIFLVNGHGANLAPLKQMAADRPGAFIRIRSWWDFDAVNALRRDLYGDWEGMHATPSEVAVTQALHRIVEPPEQAKSPPQKLSPAYLREHAGDRHGLPEDHRRMFPDGRVGSHSALATPEQGHAILETAVQAIAADYLAFCRSDVH